MIWRDFLEDDFPLGDGTADTAAPVVCPYCGRATDIVIDPGGGARQEYVEDCPICSQSWRVRLRYSSDGSAEVIVDAAD